MIPLHSRPGRAGCHRSTVRSGHVRHRERRDFNYFQSDSFLALLTSNAVCYRFRFAEGRVTASPFVSSGSRRPEGGLGEGGDIAWCELEDVLKPQMAGLAPSFEQALLAALNVIHICGCVCV